MLGTIFVLAVVAFILSAVVWLALREWETTFSVPRRAFLVMLTAVCIAASYAMAAYLAEPRAYWFWCDIGGLCS